MVRNAYSQAHVGDHEGQGNAQGRITGSTTVGEWLESLGQWLFRRLLPSFERFAPAHGPLPKEAYRRLIRVGRVWARATLREWVP